MEFVKHLRRILESKRALRRELAARPVAEKLSLLDQLRERVWRSALPNRPGMLVNCDKNTASPTNRNE